MDKQPHPLPNLTAYTLDELDTLLDHVLEARTHLLKNNWTTEGYYGSMEQLYRCQHCKEYVRATSLRIAGMQHQCAARMIEPCKPAAMERTVAARLLVPTTTTPDPGTPPPGTT